MYHHPRNRVDLLGIRLYARHRRQQHIHRYCPIRDRLLQRRVGELHDKFRHIRKLSVQLDFRGNNINILLLFPVKLLFAHHRYYARVDRHVYIYITIVYAFS